MSTTAPYAIERDGEVQPFHDKNEFETMVNLLSKKGEDFEILANGPGEDMDDTTDVEAEVVEHSKNGSNNSEPKEAELVDQTGTDRFPEISAVEGKVRSIIDALDATDMNRLIWNPNADPQAVPYNPQTLPYDNPQPSAEAFDMFATVIEQTQGVQYSVVDVEFLQDDETIGCTVVMEKQSEDGGKRLVGIKTRKLSKTQGLDHWRERLYSKARRNALKQDIPPTWVSTLIDRYNHMQVQA
jgi:hypothetical protein